MKHILKRIAVFAIITVLGVATTTVGVFACEKAKPFEGKVDVGGYSLYVDYDTQGSINPSESEKIKKPITVVFETGYGDDSSIIVPLRNEVNKFANTLVYDRAGLGKSDATSVTRTSTHKSDELHKILKKLHINHALYVAHSMGSYQALIHANLYKEDFSGVVFIDGSHPDQEVWEESLYKDKPEEFEKFKGYFTIDGDWDTVKASAVEAKEFVKPNILKEMPITVLTAGNHEMSPADEIMWQNWQNEIAALSKNSVHYLNNPNDPSKVYTHYIYTDDQPFVVQQIKDTMNRM